MSHKKPDLNAPRFRPHESRIMNSELFNIFRKKYPDHEHLSYEDFRKIVHTFNGTLYKKVVEYRDGINLPESLGSLFIGTCWKPSRKKPIDYVVSSEVGEAIEHKNYHTDGKLAKIFYTNYQDKYRFKNRAMWTFTATRSFKRYVAHTYPIEWKKYVEVDPTLKINTLYKKRLQMDYMKLKGEDLLKVYNEFDMN